jgi:MFS family permease
VNVILGLVPLAIAIWKLKGEWADAREETFDLIGSVIYSLMLVAVMFGFSQLPGTVGIALVLAGTLSFILLIKWESRVQFPVLDVNLFLHNRVYAFSNLAALISYSATFAVGFLLSLYLQYIKGLEPDQAGLVLLLQPLVMTFFSPYAGRLSDRIEPRIVATAGMALTFLPVLGLAFLDSETSIILISISLLVLGLGLSLFTSPNTNAIMSSIERRCYGVGSATLGTMRLVGQVMSMGIAMLVFSVYLGKVEILPENYPQFMDSVQVAFAIFAALCLAGIFASMARGSLRERAAKARETPDH